MALRIAASAKKDVGPYLVGTAITAWVLYMGGFWGPLFHG